MAIEILSTTNITASATAVLMLASNAARRSAQLFNPGPGTLSVGQTASVTTATGYPVPASTAFQIDPYKGDVYAIIGSGNQLIGVLETN